MASCGSAAPKSWRRRSPPYPAPSGPAAWRAHDACELVGNAGWGSPILIDQGTADEFLETQLRPELFEEACRAAGVPLTLRWQEGYDHSYYFIATFICEHIAHHARLLSETA